LEETDKPTRQALTGLIRRYADKALWPMLDHAVETKRHFERAYAVRLGCEAVGGDWRKLSSAMASVEFRFSSLVVVDDVFDNTGIRMGKPTLPQKWGNNIAVTIGAILKSLSSIALAENLVESAASPSECLRLVIEDELSHYRVYLGQYSDLRSEEMSLDDVSLDFYLEMIKNTTGVDLGFCVQLGGTLAGGSAAQTQLLYEFGIALGTAMQLRDDLLDFIDSDSTINKTPFRDVSQKKKRLPLMIAYRLADSRTRTEIAGYFEKQELSKDDKTRLSNIVLDERILLYLNRLLSDLKKNAMEKFRDVDPPRFLVGVVKEILEKILVLT
jgi:geranylgeranyl diphosphate synthase type II